MQTLAATLYLENFPESLLLTLRLFIKVSVMQVKSFEVKLFFVLPLTTCYFLVSLVINIAAHSAAF